MPSKGSPNCTDKTPPGSVSSEEEEEEVTVHDMFSGLWLGCGGVNIIINYHLFVGNVFNYVEVL